MISLYVFQSDDTRYTSNVFIAREGTIDRIITAQTQDVRRPSVLIIPIYYVGSCERIARTNKSNNAERISFLSHRRKISVR